MIHKLRWKLSGVGFGRAACGTDEVVGVTPMSGDALI